MRERDSFFNVCWRVRREHGFLVSPERVRREHGFLVSPERVWKNDF
jgi:hypothetical protein